MSIKSFSALNITVNTEAVTGGVLFEKVFLELSQNSQENTRARVSFLIKLQASAFNFIKKGTLAQLFSCEFNEIFKNTLYTQHLCVTASVNTTLKYYQNQELNKILKLMRGAIKFF